MNPVSLSAEALTEALEAAGWYERQKRGLGFEFVEELDRILSVLGARPQSFPRLADPASELQIRRALLPRFPYAVVFIQLSSEVRVLAVCHVKRRPGYWINRIKQD